MNSFKLPFSYGQYLKDRSSKRVDSDIRPAEIVKNEMPLDDIIEGVLHNRAEMQKDFRLREEREKLTNILKLNQ